MNNKSKWLAYLLIAGFLVWLFYFGQVITGRAFCDSDTCWLLAMGKWMLEHRALPLADPFSTGVSTFATLYPGTPLVQYQWLSEILFYGLYKWTGKLGLLLLMSVLAFLTFICLPYLLLVKEKCHKAIVFGTIFSVAMLASLCYYLRPQIFSYLFIALLIWLYIPITTKLKNIRLLSVLATLAIMLLWVNLHIFFPLGIIFLTLILVLRLMEICLIDKSSKISVWQFAVPFLSVLPTAFNPWGINIWMYVERLRKNTYSDLITELQPVQIFNWRDPLAQYLWLLLAVYLLFCIYYRANKLTRLGLVSPVLTIAGLYMSLQHCKLAPITSLFIFAACLELNARANMLQKQEVSSAIGGLKKFWQDLDEQLNKVLSNTPLRLAVMMITTLSGTVYASIANPVNIPQNSDSFKAPLKAIKFLKKSRPSGKVLNDPGFGSVMIWYLENPDVFFDTRFSQYEPQRLPDSIHIENCEYEWEKIWNRYGFDWVFVKPSRPIVKALRKMGWKTVFEDEAAIILTKNH